MINQSKWAALTAFVLSATSCVVAQSSLATSNPVTSPTHLTAEQDHQRMMELLHIKSIRRGADGDPKSPNAANYDESKAGPTSKLPDPLRLNNGREIKTANEWWSRRRAEIVGLFDREIYGRVPAN